MQRWPMMLSWLALAAACLVFALATRGGTVGSRVHRMRIVDKDGEPPSIIALAKRFLLALPGCLLLGATYFACRSSPTRQAGHDRWAATWLIRARAQPDGPAQVAYNTKLIGTFILTYIEVEPHTPENGDPETASPAAD